MANISELRESVRRKQRDSELWKDASSVVEEVIRLQASKDELIAETARLETSTASARIENAGLTVKIKNQQQHIFGLTTELGDTTLSPS